MKCDPLPASTPLRSSRQPDRPALYRRGRGLCRKGRLSLAGCPSVVAVGSGGRSLAVALGLGLGAVAVGITTGEAVGSGSGEVVTVGSGGPEVGVCEGRSVGLAGGMGVALGLAVGLGVEATAAWYSRITPSSPTATAKLSSGAKRP